VNGCDSIQWDSSQSGRRKQVITQKYWTVLEELHNFDLDLIMNFPLLVVSLRTLGPRQTLRNGKSMEMHSMDSQLSVNSLKRNY